MPIAILMPALSPTMTEGTLANWVKKEGEKISPGEVIAEIETDKATMEVESVESGVLGKILVQPGTLNVKVNQMIGVILEKGEDQSIIETFIASHHIPSAQKAENPKIAANIDHPSKEARSTQERIFISPLAKKIATQQNIDITKVQGTGPYGRIVKRDLDTTQPHSQPTQASNIPITTMRAAIAKRLVESKQTIPHFYLTFDCNLEKLLSARAKINETNTERKISVNDFVVKAVAYALHKIPALNRSWGENVIYQNSNVDISVAVSIPDGLITPILKDANKKSLSDISDEIKSLAQKARNGHLRPDEFQGGSFTVTNLGMYGIKHFHAIINPPQSCILAVGAAEERVIVQDGEIQVATLATFTLSCDHRVIDGALGAEFARLLKAVIEDPVLLLS